MPDPQVACNVPFLQSVDQSIFVQNCNNITVADKTRAANVGRAQARVAARQRCPQGCKTLVFIRDNAVIIRGCANQSLDFTYEGFFKCTPPAKKKEGKAGIRRARRKAVQRTTSRRAPSRRTTRRTRGRR